MWRRVLLVLLVLGNGLGASGNNQDIFEKLCHIAGNVSALMGKDNGVTSHLKEALYGDAVGASFNEDGFLTGGCGLGMVSRSQYCSHLPGRNDNNHGCFGHSLLGTFLCLCTKGNDREQDLCGLGTVGGGAWSGGWISGVTENLHKKVWEEVKQKCFKNNTTSHVGDLETAVKNIKEETKKHTISNSQHGYYLGSGTNTNGHCHATHPKDGCVTYPDKSGNPDIPWADKILEGINKLNQTQNKAKYHDSTQETSQNQDYLSDSEQDGDEQESEEQEEQDESAENHGQNNTSKTPRPRRKRTTNKQPTEQPAEPLRAILHDNGSFITQPFWLLSAVVF